MSNIVLKKTARKANGIVCLFFCLFPLDASAQDFIFDDRLQEAHYSALSLTTNPSIVASEAKSLPQDIYISSLAEAIELLVTEDQTKFSQYEERFLNRLDQNPKSSARDYQFLQAELRLHWAFVYLKFGHELDAALHLRQSYQIAGVCREKYPDYLPIRKTTGILEVIVGSVPEKYNWVLNLLSMSGSVSAGLADLQKIADSDHPLSIEGKLLNALVNSFLLQQPGAGYKAMNTLLKEQPDNRLAMFLTASLALKNSDNELTLELLRRLSIKTSGYPLHYADYLRGEAFLRKADYLNAISSYQSFINNHAGQNYIKDAHYKIGLCYLLNGNENDALASFKAARSSGKEASEADKSAARSLSDNDHPNIKLSKVRYYTDGGYYAEADKLLSSITSLDLLIRRDQVEYYYRKARLSHKLNRSDATELYLKTIELTAQDNWYFAPNACLQLGYIYQSQQKTGEAKTYFERAITYRRHEYKNSIDSKARSALAQIDRK